MSLNSVVAAIKKHHRFLIVVHANIDGDALGAELALVRLLKKLGKSAVCVNDDALPYGYEFLPGVGAIWRYRKGMKAGTFDCLVVMDSSDLNRTGRVSALFSSALPVINIDHHISNSRFGSTNWVEPDACCTCELIYRLYKRFRVPLDRNAALLLYVGILTDTGSFKYSNTKPLTHRIAADLLASGVDAADVYKKIYSSVPYEDMELLSRILPTMRKSAGGKIVWFQLPRKLFQGRKEISFDLSESILNFARSVKGVDVVMLFKENQTTGHDVRVNFRSQGNVDVNMLAGMFGGGGHRTAAGATIGGKTLDQARTMVLRKARALLEK
jgi:bifunctional oligoribonuclease and PAP phosphatase NrnA